MSKKIIITGATGQAGSYFVDFLLKNTDYEIYGMVRRLSVKNHKNIEHLKDNKRFHLFSGDLTDEHSLSKSIEEIRPDYYINAAAQSYVTESWISPVNTMNTDATAIIHILEAIRKFVPHCRFVNFASSEMFGDVEYSPQDIKHPFRSRSVYACAKVAAHQIVKVYRESYGLYAVSAICYNYEGERRGFEFVTRKITHNVARIYHSIKNGDYTFEPLELGGYDSKRDWSDATDIVDGVWRMLNQDKYRIDLGFRSDHCCFPDQIQKHIKEYILSSQENHSVREFVEKSFSEAGIQGGWFKLAKPEDEEYILFKDGLATKKRIVLVKINPKFYRPNELNTLLGDSSPARKELGWNPKVKFDELVKKMVKNDIDNYNK